MSLNIFYSTSRDELDKRCKNIISHNSKGRVFYIVPEQFSLSAEKYFTDITKNDFEVISFRRLARKILEEAGENISGYLSPSVKIMLMQNILNSGKEEFSVYEGCGEKRGFASTMVKTVAEFKHASVGHDEIADKAEEAEGYLKEKLKDFSKLYGLYNSAVSNAGIDCDDDLTHVYALLKENPNLYSVCGSMCIINNFTGFTRQERLILMLLSDMCEVHIAVISDTLNSESSVCYSGTVENIKRLVKGRSFTSEYIENKDKSLIKSFSKEYFRYPPKKLSGEGIEILRGNDGYDEICSVASEIVRLCREENYRYKDIAVVYRNADVYCHVIKRAFEMFGIPYFMDYRENVSSNSLVTFIYSIGDIFRYNFGYDALFTLIKSVFSPIETADCDVFENFILEFGLYGKYIFDDEKWSRRTDKIFDKTDYDREKINACRNIIIKPLVRFKNKTKGTVLYRVHAESLFELLCDWGVYGRLEKLTFELNEQGNFRQAQIFSQIWNTFINILDEAVSVLGDTKSTFTEFMRVLEAGMSECTLGVIPPVTDCVQVSDASRFVGGEIKALFAVGVNNGEFPANVSSGGVFEGTDRDVLEGMGIELTSGRKASAVAEQQILHKIFSAPENRLYISYRCADTDGTAVAPSEVVDRTKNILPSVKLGTEESFLSSPGYTFRKMITADDEDCSDYKNAYTWFSQNSRWQNQFKLIKQGIFDSRVRLSEKTLDKLYERGFYGSVSKLECYGSCAFSYFLKYNLKLSPRRVYKLRAPDIGNLIHSVLEAGTKKLNSEHGWDNVSLEMCRDIVNGAVSQTAPEFLDGLLMSSPRYRYTLSRLSDVLAKNLYYIARQFSKSSFRPAGFEHSFGLGANSPSIVLETDEGKRINLTGKVDRFDIYEGKDGKYLRIVDYKSGNKELKLSDIYNGLNLQLITYLDAMCGEKNLPAGVLYFKVADPYEKMDNIMEDKLLLAYLKGNYKMNGLILDNSDVLTHMDSSIEDDPSNISVNVKADKSGAYKGSLATEHQFRLLREGVKKSIKTLSAELLHGNIDVNPVSDRDNCKWCDFGNICRNKNGMRKVEKLSEEEVYIKFAEDLKNE